MTIDFGKQTRNNIEISGKATLTRLTYNSFSFKMTVTHKFLEKKTDFNFNYRYYFYVYSEGAISPKQVDFEYKRAKATYTKNSEITKSFSGTIKGAKVLNLDVYLDVDRLTSSSLTPVYEKSKDGVNLYYSGTPTVEADDITETTANVKITFPFKNEAKVQILNGNTILDTKELKAVKTDSRDITFELKDLQPSTNYPLTVRYIENNKYSIFADSSINVKTLDEDIGWTITSHDESVDVTVYPFVEVNDFVRKVRLKIYNDKLGYSDEYIVNDFKEDVLRHSFKGLTAGTTYYINCYVTYGEINGAILGPTSFETSNVRKNVPTVNIKDLTQIKGSTDIRIDWEVNKNISRTVHKVQIKLNNGEWQDVFDDPRRLISPTVIPINLELLGTWVFNDEVNVGDIEDNFEFISNGIKFYGMTKSIGIYISYKKSGSSEVTVYGGNWYEEAYKTIEILTEPTDAEFIEWLKENATHRKKINVSIRFITSNSLFGEEHTESNIVSIDVYGDYSFITGDKVVGEPIVIYAEEWEALYDILKAKGKDYGLTVFKETVSTGEYITAERYNRLKNLINEIANPAVNIADKEQGEYIAAEDINALKEAINNL